MYRITPNIISARFLLYRRHPASTQLASISSSTPSFKYNDPTERETCKIPPLPPPPPRDDRLFWGAMALLFMTGGFAVYAKRVPEIRDWLTINAPWFDDMIAFAYQENMTYTEYARERLKEFMVLLNLKPKEKSLKQCSEDGEYVPIKSQAKPEDVENNHEVKKEEKKCEKLLPPADIKGICEIEACLRDTGDTAIINYMTARDACIYYNKLVVEVMANFHMSKLKVLHDAMDERLKLVKDSIANAVKACAALDELGRYFECEMEAPKESIENTKALYNEYQIQIKAISMHYQRENDKSIAMDAQLKKVKDVLEKYTDENQTMFPGLKYMSHKPHVSGDADLLLYHTLRYVDKLKAELNEVAAAMSERVNRAVDTLPQGDKQKKNRDYEIQAGYKRKKAEMDREFRKRFDDQRAENDRISKDSYKKQVERSQETLAFKLEQKETEATENLNKMVAEKVAAEKKLMQSQLNEMTTKLQFVEDKLNARLKVEKETRRSQELWTAGASLLAATKRGEPYVNVSKEIKAIEKASGNDDKLVLTVLKGIPDSVRVKGIVPESVLREKYHTMEKLAMKVALVEQDGAPLPVYFLSWLQSVLLFMKLSGIPQHEIDKPPKVPSKDLDTFDLLQRARFWIERGNIANALRYVNSLEGASRGAAGPWREAARVHLETRQAAEAVLAHAAALGLQYI